VNEHRDRAALTDLAVGGHTLTPDERLARLEEMDRFRGAPPGLPFVFDESTIEQCLNFTLTTSLGAIDLLGEVAGGGHYEGLEAHTQVISVLGVQCRCVDLDMLIHLKRGWSGKGSRSDC